MSYTLKKIGAKDLLWAKQLLFFFQIDDGVENPIVPPDEHLEKMLSKEDFHMIVVLQNDTVVGGLTAYELEMYYTSHKELYLYELGIEPQHRRAGIARQLIEYMKQFCVQRGLKEMFAATLAQNIPAINLYDTTGAKGGDVIWFIYEF